MERFRLFIRSVRFLLYNATVEAWRETRRFHQIQTMLLRARHDHGEKL